MRVIKLSFTILMLFWATMLIYAQNSSSHVNDSIYDIEEAYLDSAFAADKIGDYLSAVRYTEKCLMVSRDTAKVIDDSPVFSEYKFLVEFYAKAGMWDKALRLQKRRTDYWENKYKESDVSLMDSTFELVWCQQSCNSRNNKFYK